MTDRDGALCRSKARLAIRVEALQHFRGCKLGQHVAGLLIEAQASLLDELHADGRRDRLSHRQEPEQDRKSTRLNSSHSQISYAVFCLKKKKKITINSHCGVLHYTL